MRQHTFAPGPIRPKRRRSILAVALAVGALVASSAWGSGPKPPTPQGAVPKDLPKFEEIEGFVHKELAKRSRYKAGDLLSRGEISGQFGEFERLGWKVSDRKSLEDQFLPDSDVLVRELGASEARGFMRRVSSIPHGFDRVDRLRRMPLGQQRLQELIRGPDGYLMIQYLATTPGGRRTGRSIAQGENGEGFNRPTGRIYTEKEWIDALRAVHERDVAERAKANTSKPSPTK